MTVTFKNLVDPDSDSIGNNVSEFLNFLGGPSSILLTGEDSSRTRAFVTLLHGNEPSGIMALFRWLKSNRKPAVNILCVVASVEAALTTPVFSYRVLLPNRDLNRCFISPYDDRQGELANDILTLLKEHKPESVIDMHNTSGSGPAFAVATHMDHQHDALTSLFTQRIIITNLRLGALMEISEDACPTVTIECGGRMDEEAHETAWLGLNRYFSEHEVLSGKQTDWGLEVLHNPVRLELRADCSVLFNSRPTSEHQLILDPGIEHLNFGITKKDTFLGWVNSNDINDIFSSTNSLDQCVLNELVYITDNKLHIGRDLKLFMITTDPEIASMDCLLYAVKSNGEEIIV